MAENLQFDDEGSRLVEAFNATPGAKARRQRLLSALSLEPGENVLDVGSGPGHLCQQMGQTVGSSGRVCGLDNSETMNMVAKARCKEQPQVEVHLGDATKLPFPDGHFDAVVSSQVFEYLSDVTGALREIHRVLRPGGRVIIHDTDWGTVAWHSSDAARMDRILDAWDGHLVGPHLPRTIAARLRRAGFEVTRQDPIVQFESSYGEDSVSHCLIEFILGYVIGVNGITEDEARAWADDLHMLGTHANYFFSLNEYIVVASKAR